MKMRRRWVAQRQKSTEILNTEQKAGKKIIG